MKIEQLIVQYLYINKQVTLQGIGTFKLDPNVVLPNENDKDKDFVMPENAFQFEYNLRAVEDEGLVNYIVEHTRKILPLASSDLDSYAILAKQFLNIGKPLVIDGVGTIQKNQKGDYQFTPGVFITPKIDDIPKQLREKRDESVSFESEARVNNSRRNLIIAMTVLFVILCGLGIYYAITNTHRKVETVPEPMTAVATDSISRDSTLTDTTSKINADTVAVAAIVPAPIPTDSNSFKIVLKSYSSADAVQNAFKRLSSYGHKLVVIKVDSTKYELAIPFKKPLSDTSRVRDSLRVFFGGKPYVKL